MDNPIKEIRKSLGITRKQLAIETECTYAWVAQLENGHPVTLSRRYAKKLSEVFGLEPHFLQCEYERWRLSLKTK